MHPQYPPKSDRRAAERRQLLPRALATCADRIDDYMQGKSSSAAMHEAVREYARVVRADGVPPERALAQLKETILRVPLMLARPAMERGEIVHALVQTAITAYYDGPATPNP